MIKVIKRLVKTRGGDILIFSIYICWADFLGVAFSISVLFWVFNKNYYLFGFNLEIFVNIFFFFWGGGGHF